MVSPVDNLLPPVIQAHAVAQLHTILIPEDSPHLI